MINKKELSKEKSHLTRELIDIQSILEMVKDHPIISFSLKQKEIELIEKLDELEDIQLYDESHNDPSITEDIALKMIEVERKKLKNKNKLISIGWSGIMKCYLNLTKEEAIDKYCKSQELTIEEFKNMELSYYEFEFDDSFEAYAVWE
jgi:hypothetical protein